VRDPDGRLVALLAPYQDLVLRAVRAPDRRRPGRWPGEDWFYLATTRPSRWLKVVVGYDEEGERWWIVTAFPRRAFP